MLQIGCHKGGSNTNLSKRIIPATQLSRFLPELNGYSVLQTRAIDTASDQMHWAFCQRVFQKQCTPAQVGMNPIAQQIITLTIFDFGHQTAIDYYARFLEGYQARSDEGYTQSEKTAGLDGWVTWEPEDKEGTVGVAVNHRFYIIAMSNKIESLESLKSVARGIDFSGIAKLGL